MPKTVIENPHSFQHKMRLVAQMIGWRLTVKQDREQPGDRLEHYVYEIRADGRRLFSGDVEKAFALLEEECSHRQLIFPKFKAPGLWPVRPALPERILDGGLLFKGSSPELGWKTVALDPAGDAQHRETYLRLLAKGLDETAARAVEMLEAGDNREAVTAAGANIAYAVAVVEFAGYKWDQETALRFFRGLEDHLRLSKTVQIPPQP